jgi:hypothetical protein
VREVHRSVRIGWDAIDVEVVMAVMIDVVPADLIGGEHHAVDADRDGDAAACFDSDWSAGAKKLNAHGRGTGGASEGVIRQCCCQKSEQGKTC